MKKTMKKLVALLLVIAMGAGVLAGCGQDNAGSPKGSAAPDGGGSDKVQQFTMGTYGATGGYMLLATGIAKIVNEHMKNVNITPVPSPKGSVENVQSVHDGTYEMGIASSNVCLDGALTREGFEEATTNTMAWFSAHFGITWSLALESSGIKTFKDMEGKKVAIGAPGSNDAYLAEHIFLPMAGVDVSKVTFEYVTMSEAFTQMKDGHIDAYIGTGAPKLASVADLASSRETRFVPMDQETIDAILAAYPEFIVEPINSDDVAGLIMDADSYPTVAMKHVVIISKEIDEDLVYQMTKYIFENLNDIYDIKEEFKCISLESALDGTAIEVHPGALRYFTEQGVAQPK